MTPFEQGYKAFLDKLDLTENPIDKETCPYGYKRWAEGWGKARQDKSK